MGIVKSIAVIFFLIATASAQPTLEIVGSVHGTGNAIASYTNPYQDIIYSDWTPYYGQFVTGDPYWRPGYDGPLMWGNGPLYNIEWYWQPYGLMRWA